MEIRCLLLSKGDITYLQLATPPYIQTIGAFALRIAASGSPTAQDPACMVILS